MVKINLTKLKNIRSFNSVKFSRTELNLIREYFDLIYDSGIYKNYLELKDYILAKKIYSLLGMRIPNSIKERLNYEQQEKR